MMRKHLETIFRPAGAGSVLLRVSDDGERHTRLYVSRDHGSSFERVHAPDPAYAVAACGDRWLVITGAELRESRDGGASWRAHPLPGEGRVLETVGDRAWIAWRREVLVYDGTSVATRWRLPDPSPGGGDERVTRLVPIDAEHGLACTNRAQIYRVGPDSPLLVPWSEGLAPPERSGSATYKVSRLGDIYCTGEEIRRDDDPAWHAIAAGVPDWAAHIAPILAVPFSAWVAAPWRPDTWIGRDPTRVLEAGRTVIVRWTRPDTWTHFKTEPRAGESCVYVGLHRVTPELGGLVVREHAVEVVPLPAGVYEEL